MKLGECAQKLITGIERHADHHGTRRPTRSAHSPNSNAPTGRMARGGEKRDVGLGVEGRCDVGTRPAPREVIGTHPSSNSKKDAIKACFAGRFGQPRCQARSHRGVPGGTASPGTWRTAAARMSRQDRAMVPFLMRAAVTGFALWVVTLFVPGMGLRAATITLQRVAIIFVVGDPSGQRVHQAHRRSCRSRCTSRLGLFPCSR